MTATLQRTLGERAHGIFGAGVSLPVDARQMVTSGDFLRATTQRLPGVCGDERLDIHGTRLLVPTAFGGFGALVVTDALTTRRWYKPGMTFKEHALGMYPDVHRQFPHAVLGLHTDTHAIQAAKTAAGQHECGCAAIAKAQAVVSLLVQYSDLIGDEYEQGVVANARQLLSSGYFQTGTATVVDDLAKSLDLPIEILAGPHNGVLFAVVQKDGMVLDRPALYKAAEQRGVPVPYVFVYDQWALRSAAHYLAPDAAAFFFAGGNALNMATMLAIGAPDMAVDYIG